MHVKDQWLSVEEIIQLMEAFDKNKMGALELSSGDQSLKLKERETPKIARTAHVESSAPLFQSADATVSAELPETELPGNLVKSPIVGTFYASPAPDKPPFSKVGQQVKKGDVLFIIESMKLMNEVVSEYEGTVEQILVENAQPVEYGEPILRIV